jgi:hypothetical protein
LDWVILFCSKPTYTASLSFALEDEKSGGGLGGAWFGEFIYRSCGGGGSIFTGSNLTELFKSRNGGTNLLSPVTPMEKYFYEMYIQNACEIWNENPKYKIFSFCQRQIEKSFTRVHDSILG